MKRSFHLKTILALALILSLVLPGTAIAQEETPVAADPELRLTTTYPSQVAELGESVTIRLNLQAIGASQTVQLEMDEIPEGWSATFRGGGRIIYAVHVSTEATESFDLRLDPPAGVEPGTYNFVVLARGQSLRAELPISLTIQERVPASLTFETDLPTIIGSPSTTFRYNATLKNEGDEELTVNLSADVPLGFLARFKVAGQETSSFPLGADESKNVVIELEPVVEVAAGSYPVTVFANSGEVQAVLNLNAEVTGQHNLSVSGLDGRLSGRAVAGEETTLQIVVSNTGTAAAQGVEMSATAPNGWTITFDPEVIAEIPAGQQVEVTAMLKPADQAIAGDYIVTVRARPAEGANKTTDFRITVSTSTLWGVIGLALIAVAVGVVAIAVMRFGRR
jgi:uncharacterized repeat protein (TIGR01451 family)